MSINVTQGLSNKHLVTLRNLVVGQHTIQPLQLTLIVNGKLMILIYSNPQLHSKLTEREQETWR